MKKILWFICLIVGLLVENAFSMYAPQEELSYAINAKNVEKIFQIIKANPNILSTLDVSKTKAIVNAKNEIGATPLHVAAKHGNVAVIKTLLGAGAEVNAKDNKGDTPLHDAIPWNAEDHINAINALLTAGAEVDAKNDDDKTPLTYAEEAKSYYVDTHATQTVAKYDALIAALKNPPSETKKPKKNVIDKLLQLLTTLHSKLNELKIKLNTLSAKQSEDVKLLENFSEIENQIAIDLGKLSSSGLASIYPTYEAYKAKTAFSLIVKSVRKLKGTSLNGYIQFKLFKMLGTIEKLQNELAPLEKLLADEKKKEEEDHAGRYFELLEENIKNIKMQLKFVEEIMEEINKK